MRKTWTAQTNITDSLLKFREKRKWQIALRRYLIDQKKCSFYAPYFGLDMVSFRHWIEIQFDPDLGWKDFSSSWQFDHVLPLGYFDFSDPQDLRLCWNFINIRVERFQSGQPSFSPVNVLTTRRHFETLFQKTGYFLCGQMVEKIKNLQSLPSQPNPGLTDFIQRNKSLLATLSTFGSREFDRLNEGISPAEVQAEKDLIQKFGGRL